MTSFAPIPGLIGGALIGLSAVMLMLGIGRVAGISGIVSNAMVATDATDRPWRLAFILGLPLGGTLVTAHVTFATSTMMTAVAGLFVGVGTTLGSGCTSGHGICGLSRLSYRSIVATATFMATAAATVFIVRHLL